MAVANVKQIWELPETDFEVLRKLSEELDVHPVVAEILFNRGYQAPDDARSFLNPTNQALTSPFDLTGIEDAVARITTAREHGEHIRVIGDYDVDGIAGTALIVRALRRFGIENVSYALPNRLTDGYGINSSLVEQAAEEKIALLITVDNGISATEAADTAAQKNVDLIITDHHTLPPVLPSATSIINPKLDDPEHPFANACGAAVAFKLAQALNNQQHDLGLVAMATIADIVPVTKENRTLTALGLAEIQQDMNFAISALARKCKLNTREIRAEDIAYQIAPRINASGRIGTGYNALEFLLTDNIEEVDYLAGELEATNTERRRIEAGIYEEARDMSVSPEHKDRPVAILASNEWHPGVIGIAAAKLMYELAKPVFLVAIDEQGIGRGSGRSTAAFNLAEGLHASSQWLVKYGGHQAAAGFTIEAEKLDHLRDSMDQQATIQQVPQEPVRTVHLDGLLSFTDINEELLYELDRLEPFGKDNPVPVFATYGVEILANTFHALKGNHVKCSFKQAGRTIPAIGFNMADTMEALTDTKKVNISYTPKFNTWRGATQIQLQLKEISAP